MRIDEIAEVDIVFDSPVYPVYRDYEDYIKKVHSSPLPMDKSFPGNAIRKINSIYRHALEIIAKSINEDIDRRDLLQIAIYVYRVSVKDLGIRVSVKDLGIATAYIYLYNRGIKLITPSRVTGLLMRIAHRFQNMGNRFIKLAINRISQDDVNLHRILSTSIIWLSKKTTLSPSRLIECACRIASIIDTKYNFKQLVSRFIAKPEKTSITNRYTHVTRILKKLGIHIDLLNMNAEIPKDLCIELENSRIMINRQIIKCV